MDCDTSSADALLDRVELYVTEGWQTPAAMAAEATVRDLTARGLDADETAFAQWGDFYHAPGSGNGASGNGASGNGASGNGASGNGTGDVYSPRQTARRTLAGVSVDVKDLMVTGALLGGGQTDLFQGLGIRKLDGITTLSVASEASDKLNKIAMGQMAHPNWKYHHKFLAVGRAMMRNVYAAVLAGMKFGIGGRGPFHTVQ